MRSTTSTRTTTSSYLGTDDSVGSTAPPPARSRAAEELAELVTGELPDLDKGDDLAWVRHRSAAALFIWAARTVGPDAALGAVRYVLEHVAVEGGGALDLELLVVRARGRALRWAAGASSAVPRGEVSVASIEMTAPEVVALATGPDPLELLPAWLACATGQALSPEASCRLIVCATIAVDLAASDDLRPARCSSPIAGIARRRLPRHLDPPLTSHLARLSVARLLLGPSGRAGDGVLSRLAHGASPRQVPAALRSNWAADMLDLEEVVTTGSARHVARERARRHVLTDALMADSVGDERHMLTTDRQGLPAGRSS